jgi:hypothetical protein
VAALYPEHEIESFTDLFFARIQQWRRQEGGSRAASPASAAVAGAVSPPLPPG